VSVPDNARRKPIERTAAMGQFVILFTGANTRTVAMPLLHRAL